MHDDADVIEISSQASSPQPEHFVSANPKPMQNATRNSKGKGKMKQQDAEVIELTDSSDEDDEADEVQLLKDKPRPQALPCSPSPRRKSKWTIVIDDSSDGADVGAAPARLPHGLSGAGPSRAKAKVAKERLPVNEETVNPGSSGGGHAGSSRGGEVIRVDGPVGLTTDGWGKSRFADVVRWLDGNDKGKSYAAGLNDEDDVFGGTMVRAPPRSSSPLASPARIVPVPGPTIIADGPEPGAPPPPPLLESPEETMSRYVAQVLEIVPDVDPEHCATLVSNHVHLNDASVERILHVLFEDPNYPRVQNGAEKGKRKADGGGGEESGRPNKKAKGNGKGKGKAVDHDDELWMNVERPFVGGINYHTLALNTLQQEYPLIPKVYLRNQLSTHKGFYAPTFFFLRQLSQQMSTGLIARENYPYEPKKTRYRPTQGKGKEKERALEDGAFERELAWVKNKLSRPETADANGEANDSEDADAENDDNNDNDEPDPDESDGEDEENGIECGCCFSKYRFEKMIQCPDAHLFCLSCLCSYSSTLLGSHNPKITCMSQSPCSLLFPSTQLKRVLNKKTYRLYERLIQQKEITEANLEGLEECPFCEWKCVIDVSFEGEKLFRCGGCEVTSCRKCKKLDHLPKSCEEVEGDKKLDARHVVEEAMTQALMRNCPKCKKAFIKESGCNKMTCPNCRTISCYVCRQIIAGYDHFDQRRPPGNLGSSSKSKGEKCLLWDKDLDAMHAHEVKLAADQALAEARLMHPEVAINDLKVDLPSSSSSSPPKDRMREALIRRQERYGMLMEPPLPPLEPRAGGGRRRRGQNANRGGGLGMGMGGALQVPPMPAGLQHVHFHVHPPAPHPQPQPPRQMHHHHHHHHHRALPSLPPLAGHPAGAGAGALQAQPQQPPYHEAVAQAMLGQYRPLEGGVEVGGRVLRARMARAGANAAAAAGPNEVGGGNGGVRVGDQLQIPMQPAPPVGDGGEGEGAGAAAIGARRRHLQAVAHRVLAEQQERHERRAQLLTIVYERQLQQQRRREARERGEGAEREQGREGVDQSDLDVFGAHPGGIERVGAPPGLQLAGLLAEQQQRGRGHDQVRQPLVGQKR